MNKLREQLNSRISNGEKDLTIKYIKGAPKILSMDYHRSTYQLNNCLH